MTRYATISHLGQTELDHLAGLGIVPTPAEVVELSALGWMVESPETMAYMARGVPVHVGGTVLWPLTMQGGEWYGRVGDACEDRNAAVAYAMAHGADAALPMATERDVNEWAKKLRCTRGQLNVAIAEVSAQTSQPEMPPEPDNAKSQVNAHIPLVATLIAAVGGTVEMWERGMSIASVNQIVDAIIMQNAEEGKANAADPRLKAQVALYWASEKIRRRWAAKGAADA